MKRFLAVMLSVLMVMTMLPFQAFAAGCDHKFNASEWASISTDFKTQHPELDPTVAGEDTIAFVSVTVPGETCLDTGWRIDRGTDSGFCPLCGEFFVDGNKIDIESDVVAQGATVVPATGHNLVTVTEPGCITPGLAECSNVNYTLEKTLVGSTWTVTLKPINCMSQTVEGQTKVIDPLGHDFVKDETNSIDATCEAAGTLVENCSRCPETRTTTIPALGHDWDDGTVIADPSCTAPGTKKVVCKNDASHVDFVTIPATGHSPVADHVVDPTCTNDGYTIYKCSVCGYEEQGDVVPALGHDLEEIDRQEATCENAGYVNYQCKRTGCSYTETVPIPATGHSVPYPDYRLPETCEEDGYEQGICTNTGCGKKVITVLPAKGHTFTKDDTVDATCEEAGYELWVCHNNNERTGTECGASYKVALPALGHTWGTVQVQDPTCTQTGKKYQVCSTCGAEKVIEVISALNHSYVSTVVPATCTEQGYTEYVCQRTGCGYTYQDSFVDALGHDMAVDPASHVDPTCTATGKEVYRCQRSGCSYYVEEEIQMVPHTWVITIDKYPTCTEEGRNIWNCSVCGSAFIEPVDPTGHNFTDASRLSCVHGMHCTNVDMNTGVLCDAEDGSRDYSCELVPDPVYASLEKLDVPAGAEEDAAYRIIFKDYDENIYTNYTQAEIVSAMIAHTGHDYDITYVKATCEMDGYWLLKCTNGCPTLDADGNVLETPDGVLDTEEKVLAENEIIKIINANTALGHKWALLDDGSAKQPTCTEDGYRHYMCLNDHSHTYTEKLPATGHTYTYKEYVEADCTHGGYKLYACDVCGAETKEYITDKLPHNYVVTDTVAATCTTEGYEVYTCNVCDASYTNVTTPALGHNYVVKSHGNATCTTPGYDVYGCTRCNAPTYNVTTEQALGHNYVVKNHINATCTAPGYDVYSCSRCNDTYNVTAEQAKGHDYRYVADKSQAATCGKDGYRFYECAASGCDASKTEVIPATGAHKYTRTTVAATCTTEGYEVYTCDVCHASYTNVTTPAKGHHYVVVDKTPATCTAQGYDTYECVDCGKSYTETTTSALGHDYVVKSHVDATCTTEGYDVYGCSRCDADTYKVSTQPVIAHDWVEAGYAQKIDKDGNLVVNDDGEPVYDVPDCGNDGTMLYECTMCHDTRTEVVPATGDHAFTETVVTAATCTEDGTMDHVCEVCGYAYSTVIPATGHSMLYTETPATCTENGKMVAKCANCDYTETYVIPATGHTYDTKGVYTPSTCVEDGYTTYTCTVCKKASVTKTEDKAAGHVFKASVTNPATLNADGTITTACIHCGKATAKTIPGIKSITLNTTSYVYTGKACRPGVTIIDSEGNVITSANYELTYENNKKIGKASVTIKFKGNYAGTVKKSFKIVPKNVGISDISTSKGQIRFTWGKVANCDGYQIQYSTSKTFKSKKTITVKSRKTCTQVLDNLKSGKKYSIRIRAYKVVDGKKIYGNWSTTTKKCK